MRRSYERRCVRLNERAGKLVTHDIYCTNPWGDWCRPAFLLFTRSFRWLDSTLYLINGPCSSPSVWAAVISGLWLHFSCHKHFRRSLIPSRKDSTFTCWNTPCVRGHHLCDWLKVDGVVSHLIPLAHLQFSVTLTLPFREINLFMLLALILSINGDWSYKAPPPLPLWKRMQTKNRKRCPITSLTVRFRRDEVL